MSLAQFTKIIVMNTSDQTITYTEGGRIFLSVDGLFVDPETGKQTYEEIYAKVEAADFDAGGNTIAQGVEVAFAEIDNTSNKYLGYRIQIEVDHDEGAAVTTGGFVAYVSEARLTNDGPADQTGYVTALANGLDNLGTLTWETNGANDDLQTSNSWER